MLAYQKILGKGGKIIEKEKEDLIATIVACTDDSNCPGETIEIRYDDESQFKLMFVSHDSGRGYREEEINIEEVKETLLCREKDLGSNLQDVQKMIKILKIRP